ncbi:34833_t:CDS:2 [Gigaspora margarita]|uniref:34833_t:CDS:1 n=1 Tax=Gigaspora margarita TaxID=4874 RepID=A0ABN7URB9_GIGMA|nr:34833_t:CDS:2 [Gigaspora margarita]
MLKTTLTQEKIVKYTELSVSELKEICKNAKVQAIHKAMQIWVQALEEFHSDVGFEALKEQQKVALAFGDFSLASLLLRQNDSQASLVNAFNGLEAFPDELSYVLGEHDQNILEIDDQNKKAKGEKKDIKREGYR